jgi:hypothetical protein
VFTVTLACTADPFTGTEVDAQAGGGLALVETMQASVTVPLKPPAGVMVVVKVDEPPVVTVATEGFGADNEKLAPAAVTVSVTVAGWTKEPDVPTTVMG